MSTENSSEQTVRPEGFGVAVQLAVHQATASFLEQGAVPVLLIGSRPDGLLVTTLGGSLESNDLLRLLRKVYEGYRDQIPPAIAKEVPHE